ncbi:MAG: L,D-transpeptidase family protein [Saprospiraceae bacterium]|nr:L,D-transpeptidase family protein [Pyrinomonadaceae bacterium]
MIIQPELSSLNDPRIIIRKRLRTLEIMDGDQMIKSYPMVLGFSPIGYKEFEGDGKTPEGEFYVFTRNSESKFHLSLGISYPSLLDAERGLNVGVITADEFEDIKRAKDIDAKPPQKTRLGGEIYIHGGGIGNDWTDGCVALANKDIEEIFGVIPVGTKVSILP